MGKFGLSALAQSLAREFGPEGVHVGHVVLDGESGPCSIPMFQAIVPLTGVSFSLIREVGR